MKRIAVFADIHGNYDALRAIYEDAHQDGITEIYSLGDNIAIGPEPRKTIDLLIDQSIISIKGNHEIYYTDIVKYGTTNVPVPELHHQLWVAHTLGESYYDYIDHLKYDMALNYEGVEIYLCHYPFKREKNKFKGFIDLADELNREYFDNQQADLYIFGHQHRGIHNYEIDDSRYINLCSAGTTRINKTTYLIISIDSNSYDVTFKEVEYDRNRVLKKLDEYNVPERDTIKKIFYGEN